MCVNEPNILRMKELIEILKEADVAYYRDDTPTMTDLEYDLLTDEKITKPRLISPTKTVPPGVAVSSPTVSASGVESLFHSTIIALRFFFAHSGTALSHTDTATIAGLVVSGFCGTAPAMFRYLLPCKRDSLRFRGRFGF